MRLKCGLLAAMLLGLATVPAFAQGRTISGRVRDSATGAPLPGARVGVLGGTTAVSPNASGQFTLTNLPAGEVTLQVRAIGYRRQDIRVPAGLLALDVALARDIFKIEEIVITGQATGVERRNLANAVGVVGAEELNAHPTASIEQQLQGKVAGADIQTNSGAPGGGVQVRLRGVTSINATAEPLWVVDGVIVSDIAIASNANAITGAAGGSNPALTQDGLVNRISDLNPGEIESITILKGASAAAIYGGRASNGVVIIRTKRGRAGESRLQITQRLGFSSLLRKIGARRFRDAAEVDASGAFGPGTGATYCGTGPCPFFDHEEELAGRKAFAFQTSANVSGGNENSRYYASGTIEDTPGIITNTAFKRQSVRLNLDQRLSTKWDLSVNTNVLHSRGDRGLTNNDNNGISYYYVLTGTPTFVDLRARADGSFPNNPFQASNPLQTAALTSNKEDVWRVINSSRITWNPLATERSSLRLTATGGLDYFIQKNTIFSPPVLQYEDDDGLPGTSLLSNSDNLNLNMDGNAVHTYTGRGFSATTSAGVQYARRSLDVNRVESRNLIAGQSNVSSGTAVRVRENRSLIKDLGFFAQEEILLMDNRLLLTAGLRADQSSLNADAGQLYYYPKAGASYRIEGRGGLISELKIRAAYGQTGNQPLYAQRFTALNSTLNLGGLPGLVVGGATGSTTLRPERQKEIEVGMDGQFLRNRVSLEASYFQKNVSDLLLTRNLPPSSGFAQEIFNGGSLRTRGVEVGVVMLPVQGRDLNLISRVTFAKNHSKVTSLPVPTFQSGGFGSSLGVFQIEEGKSATQIVGRDTVAATVGDQVLGDANPEFRMAFTNTVTWKNLTLSALLDWQQGGNVINLTRLLQDAFGNAPDGAAGNDRIGAWAGGHTSQYIERATFVKVRELSLGWEVPQRIASTLRGVRTANISVSARNLFWLATPYKGFDPEVSNFGNQPIARNIDVTPYPPSRTFFFTINLGL